MEKRVVITSDFRPNKRCKRYLRLEDRISRLSDDILVHILSYLTLKEAARTSILSTRWKDLWSHTPTLDFNADEVLDKLRKYYILQQQRWESRYSLKLQRMELYKYVRWVNQVLKLHKSIKLTEFKVSFDIGKSHQRSIHEWIKYAYTKDVHKLELGSIDSNYYVRYFENSCTFPNPLSLTSDGLKDGFKSLRELCLNCVNVSGEVLGYFLNKCPFLERLIVHCSGHLVTLEVSGPALKLKHLEIVFCNNIKFIRLSDTNLVSLIFKSVGELQLHNVPMLVDVSFCRRDEKFVSTVLSWLSCCLSQLEVLSLTIPIEAIERMEGRNFPELTQLKELIVVADAEDNRSLIGIASLTRVCPFLQKLVVKLRWCYPSRRRRAFKGAIRSPLRHLKEFELSGYYGRDSEVELITYVLQNATSLEKITIDPREHFEPHQQRGTHEIERVQAVRCCAKNQLRVIPQHIDLVIL